MLGLKLNQLCDFWEPLKNFFNGLFQFFARLFYYLIIVAIGKIADICQLVMRKFAGISDGIKLEGQEITGQENTSDLVYWIFQTSIVKNLLISLTLLAVFILIIATFVGTIKTEFAKDGNNNKRKVIKNAFRGLANFVLVPVICMFGIYIGNALLKAIDGATSPGSGQSLSAQMFVVGGYNANRARKGQNGNYDGINNPYKSDESGDFGRMLVGQDGTGPQRPEYGYGNFGIFVDDNASSVAGKRAADKIDLYFANTGKIEKISGLTARQKTLKYGELSNWYGGQWTGDVKLDYKEAEAETTSTTDVKSEIVLKDGQTIEFSIYNVGLVYYYYDLGFGSFDYLTTAIALIFCAYTLLITVLGLIKRLFMLVTLFVISAPVCAIYPIDDGKSLEKWRTAFIKETLSAYSVVVVMNLFLSLIPLFNQLTLFTGDGDLLFLSGIPFIVDFANYMARVLIVIGALTFFKKATQQIADIIGAGNSYSEGAEASGAFAKNVGRVAGGVALGAGAARLAGKIATSPFRLISAGDKKLHEHLKTKDTTAKFDRMKKELEDAKTEGPASTGGEPVNPQLSGTPSGENAETSKQPAVNSQSSGPAEAPKDGKAEGVAGAGTTDNSVNTPETPKLPEGTSEQLEKPEKPKRPKKDNGHTRGYKIATRTLGVIGAPITVPLLLGKLAGKGVGFIKNSSFGKALSKGTSGFLSGIKNIITGKVSLKDSYHFEKGSKDNKWRKEADAIKEEQKKIKAHKAIDEKEAEAKAKKALEKEWQDKKDRYKQELKEYNEKLKKYNDSNKKKKK